MGSAYSLLLKVSVFYFTYCVTVEINKLIDYRNGICFIVWF